MSAGPMRTLSPTLARRLAIMRQRLAGAPPPADADGIMEVMRDLGRLQLDPISVVARSHLLVLWSRLGKYDPAHLEMLLWQERRLFEYKAHIVLTEEYPFHQVAMRDFATGHTAWPRRVRKWMEENHALRDHILTMLRDRGPLLAREFADKAVTHWQSSGWTAGRNVSQMLDFLWAKGEVMTTGRKGGQRLWDLTDRCLPAWTPRGPLSDSEHARCAVQRALRRHGVARQADLPGCPDLSGVLASLEVEGRIEPVRIGEEGRTWPGAWYLHTDDWPLVDRLAGGEWEPRTTLLSPFDPLIYDRERTETLFGFRFRLEMYVPPAKREYGYYMLPILHGEHLVGRVDPAFDRKRKRLTIHSVHAEPDAGAAPEVAASVAGAILELAEFLGAATIDYSGRVPEAWERDLR
jgi:uncharacterized protein YcaQ